MLAQMTSAGRLEYHICDADFAGGFGCRHFLCVFLLLIFRHIVIDHEIKSSIDRYIESISHDTLTVLEKLDIREFNKSRKSNGMMSTFARGKLQKKLMETLNWYGYDFKEVVPDYTSQTCPVCSHLEKENRNGKSFKCKCCGYEADADYQNGA